MRICTYYTVNPTPLQSPSFKYREELCTFRLLVIMRHLKTRSLESALDIETLVRLRTIQNCLVAADFLGDKIERLDELEAEFLSLLVFCDRDVFDVSYETEVVDTVQILLLAFILNLAGFLIGHIQLALNNQRASSHNPPSILNNQQIVTSLPLRSQKFISFIKLLFRDVANDCEHTQAVEEADTVVRFLECAEGVGWWELGCDCGRYEIGGEERLVFNWI